jgi:hypothetical protein
MLLVAQVSSTPTLIASLSSEQKDKKKREENFGFFTSQLLRRMHANVTTRAIKLNFYHAHACEILSTPLSEHRRN